MVFCAIRCLGKQYEFLKDFNLDLDFNEFHINLSSKKVAKKK